MRFGAEGRILKTIFIYSVLFSTMFVNACGQSKQEKMRLANQHKDKALQLRYEGRIEEAIREQLQAIDLNPDDSSLLVNLTGFYLDNGKVEKAKNTAERLLAKAPNNAWGHYLYAESLLKLDEKEKSLAEYKKASDLEPANPLFLVNLGVLYGELNNVPEQKKAYEKALEINPNYTDAIYNLALLEERENNNERAVVLFKRVIDLETENKEMLRRAQEKLDIFKNKKVAKP
ncbi:MAG: tetratricopeptide repeat protein [Acidobacteria bacterium]|jgi:superkiller protein 3|nr:tetratricopeptide repeat protein [Acidobacteriota bacterium]